MGHVFIKDKSGITRRRSNVMKFQFVILLLTLTALSPLENSLVKTEPMSYIRAAEDIGCSKNLSRKDLQNVRHLYVLAAVLDPSLRQSSILGLASVEQNDVYINLLHSMSESESDLLVPDVVLSRSIATRTQQLTPTELCKTVEKIRNGEDLKLDNLKQLQSWRHLFPDIYDRTSKNPIMRKPLTSPLEILKTIKVELAILGGPTVWSADFVNTQGRPVTFSQSEDLASLFGIDPTKTNYIDGKWVSD